MKKLQQEIKKFCKERNWHQYHNPKDLLLGIVEEVGEIRNLVKWEQDRVEIDKSLTDNREEFKDNIGDMLWFISILANNYDIDLEQALEEVIELNKKRFPLSKTKNKHTNPNLGGHDGDHEKWQ